MHNTHWPMPFGIKPGILNLVRPFAMVDLESLGTKLGSPVIEIGICHYKNGAYTTRSEFVQPDWDKADGVTLKWWRKQEYWSSIQQQIKLKGHPSLTRAFLTLVEDFSFRHEIELKDELLKFYALGPQFDISMLNHQLQISEDNLPWHFRNIRDLRTSFDDLNNGVRPEVELVNDIPHSAASDAERQARQLVHIQQRTTIQTTMNLPGK